MTNNLTQNELSVVVDSSNKAGDSGQVRLNGKNLQTNTLTARVIGVFSALIWKGA